MKLEPYIFELANDLYDYKETFHELGVKPDVDFEVLKSVLEHLSQKYQLIEDNITTIVCFSEFIDIFEYRFGHMYIFRILFLPIRVDDVLKMFQDNMLCWWVVPL
jgi:hypothetical protein